MKDAQLTLSLAEQRASYWSAKMNIVIDILRSMGGSIKWPYNDSECLDADFFKVNK